MTHQQRYNWQTHWSEAGAYDKSELPGTRQTKYQAFSIENYLKHLLKVPDRSQLQIVCLLILRSNYYVIK